MTMADEIQTLLTNHFRAMEARIDKHEQRMREINDEHRRRNEAILARLQLELDALPR